MKQRLKKGLTGLQLKLMGLKEDKSPYKEYIKETVPMLENIVECIFSTNIVLEKGKVATCEFTTPVQVLFNASKVFEGVNIKKEVENDLLSCLAPLTVESCNLLYLGEVKIIV